MNRGIALFVGLAALFAHTLAIHSDGSGSLPPAYDEAYAAFRLARSLVHEGVLRWNPSDAAGESYASLPWVLWIAVGERLRVSPNTWSQVSGILAALGSVVLLSRFRTDRTASLIGPMMLVVSGGLAAAAASGTESAPLALLVTAAFLAYERGWTRRLGAALALLCLMRPDGCWIAAALGVLRVLAPRGGARVRAGAFLAPAAAVAIAAFVRLTATGSPFSPTTASMLAAEPGQWREGAGYLRDFVVSAVTPAAVVIPLAYLLRGSLTATGRHALFLAATWSLGVLLQGGGMLPFYAAMVPCLPLLFHAVQEGLTGALDSGRWYVRRPAMAVLVLGLVLSAVASTYPADRGPLPTESLHTAWMRPATRARPGYEEPLGRLGLAEEIRTTARLRAIGLFLRDNVDPEATVLTPWPGSIAYLSRLRVLDMLGRATPVPGSSRCASWHAPRRVDVVAWLEALPDYVVPAPNARERPPSREELAAAWLAELDARGADPGRGAAIELALGPYEVISVPISLPLAGTAHSRTWPFYLLRRRDLELRPTLEVTTRGRELAVNAYNRGHRQMASLRVVLEAPGDRTWSLRPTGEATETASVFARSDLLIYPTGGRSITLARFTLPELELRRGRLRVVLVNPGSGDDRDFWTVSDEVVLPLK